MRIIIEPQCWLSVVAAGMSKFYIVSKTEWFLKYSYVPTNNSFAQFSCNMAQ